ncbi:MAG TPA: molybdopterin-guanine dinucleotide biosynthesis protein B [Casimicrobiaceae bacterium]|nr:molybdopterin-guanine dinucleotide biosynthesis protein B [Casimicrobiaceae bacterium]
MRVFGFAGWSGSGKTTLIEQLIPRFVAHGLVVSLVKHAHMAFDLDHPGKDSFRHREAGCREVLVTSAARWALQHELRGAPELTLEQALQRLAPCDLALVEGFKAAAIAKLEVYRASVGKPLLHPHDPNIVAVATDGRLATALPVLPLGDPDKVATFMLRHLGLRGVVD